MVRITYPEDLKCPFCKSVIRLDYSDKNYVKTDDLLVLNIEVPYSYKYAKDRRSNKQDLGEASPRFVIFQSCQTILGTYQFTRG
ncbi:MAG: hypothetical protein ACFFDT_03345 [Candidatus Hodarchaeota archaeon]